jgi:nucleotide-binding universal stress UspA family protein
MTTPITHILVPTDFSPASDTALTYAIDLAQTMGARISLIHVFEDPAVMNMYSEQYMPLPEETIRGIRAEIDRLLAERAARRGTVPLESAVVMGTAERAIVDQARDTRADLIVMGTHGRHGVAHLLLGSVAERVVRTAACPVLTVRGAAQSAAVM